MQGKCPRPSGAPFAWPFGAACRASRSLAPVCLRLDSTADMFTQLDYMEKRGSGLRKMRELTEKLPNFLAGKEPHYKTEASSFFTTFYNLDWGENGRIPVEEVADRVNSTLKKYPVNEEGSEKKFGVTNNASMKKFGVKGEKTSKRVSHTEQKIIDLVISGPSITAEAMSVKIGVSKRAVEKNIKELRDRGVLVHEGSDKAGYWRIIVKP